MADFEYPDADDRIAVIHAEGEIVYNQNEPGSISEKRYIKALDRVLNDETVKGVVLRVNSPGGDAFTSEVIYQAINKIKAKGIPVVASFGDYAASGGYYIACNADKIYSQPNTLTGSIGVFSMFPDATGLLNDKIGINFDTIKTHNYSVGFSPVLPLTDEEAMLLQASTDDMYQKFTQRVAEGRKLSMDSVKVIAQGRVWTGKAAQSIGLVDEMGGLSEAIAYTAAQANIDNFELIHYPSVKKDFLSTLLSEIQKGQDMDEDSRSMIKLSQEQKNLL